jgi:uncharacterized ferredoxin-like protein
MKIIEESTFRKESVMQIAKNMLLAARTAPKARGVDRLFMGIIEDDETQTISNKMKKIANDGGPAFFERDANNILQADVVIVIGTSYGSQGLQRCGYCGFGNCEAKDKQESVPCVFNTGDLGIAIGSAVSIAMDNRIDNRILYSAGYTAIQLQLVPSDVKLAYVIPLSVSSKNPFFDRG